MFNRIYIYIYMYNVEKEAIFKWQSSGKHAFSIIHYQKKLDTSNHWLIPMHDEGE